MKKSMPTAERASDQSKIIEEILSVIKPDELSHANIKSISECFADFRKGNVRSGLLYFQNFSYYQLKNLLERATFRVNSRHAENLDLERFLANLTYLKQYGGVRFCSLSEAELRERNISRGDGQAGLRRHPKRDDPRYTDIAYIYFRNDSKEHDDLLRDITRVVSIYAHIKRMEGRNMLSSLQVSRQLAASSA